VRAEIAAAACNQNFHNQVSPNCFSKAVVTKRRKRRLIKWIK